MAVRQAMQHGMAERQVMRKRMLQQKPIQSVRHLLYPAGKRKNIAVAADAAGAAATELPERTARKITQAENPAAARRGTVRRAAQPSEGDKYGGTSAAEGW